MGEVPLARLWHLTDGTICLLLKDPHRDNWELRVTRNDVTLRSERFASPLVAMEVGKAWRPTFDQAISSSTSDV